MLTPISALSVWFLAAFAPEPRVVTWPDDTAAAVAVPSEALREQCDGSRSRVDVKAASCTRWKIEWTHAGRIWGVTSADSLEGLIAARERMLGFARTYARLFDASIDPRWEGAGAPVCDACSDAKPTPPPEAAGAASPARPDPIPDLLGSARAELRNFEVDVLQTHVPRLRDLARLAHEPATAKAANAYAKALAVAVLAVPRLQLEVDNAAVYRTVANVHGARTGIAKAAKALDVTADALAAVLARASAKLHAGVFTADGVAAPGSPQLVVKFEGAKVTGTFVQGEVKTEWFTGSVGLDGTIAGTSLVAPEGAALTCTSYSVSCGYVAVPAQLRFQERTGAPGSKQIVELWFQQSKWVHSQAFSR